MYISRHLRTLSPPCVAKTAECSEIGLFEASQTISNRIRTFFSDTKATFPSQPWRPVNERSGVSYSLHIVCSFVIRLAGRRPSPSFDRRSSLFHYRESRSESRHRSPALQPFSNFFFLRSFSSKRSNARNSRHFPFVTRQSCPIKRQFDPWFSVFSRRSDCRDSTRLGSQVAITDDHLKNHRFRSRDARYFDGICRIFLASS